MNLNFMDAIKKRRTHYGISNEKVISDERLEELIESAVEYVPSAFNAQGTRIVLLLGDNHKKLWEITMEALRKVVPEDKFGPTEDKINSFASGYGTILYFEDYDLVKNLQDNFPLYEHNFPTWAQQTNGMHQYVIWTAIHAEGYGASLQHYNELIEDQVKKEWNLPESWKIVAQMPFGNPIGEPGEKEVEPLENRIRVFK